MATPKKYEHIDFTPPEGVANAAAKGLELRQKASPSNRGGLTVSEAAAQGIGSGVQRAVNLKNRDKVSPKVIKQMRGFLSRSEKSSKISPEHKGTPWNDKGYVAWLLWGGDPAVAWTNKIIKQMEAADEKEKRTAVQRVMRRQAGLLQPPPKMTEDVLAWVLSCWAKTVLAIHKAKGKKHFNERYMERLAAADSQGVVVRQGRPEQRTFPIDLQGWRYGDRRDAIFEGAVRKNREMLSQFPDSEALAAYKQQLQQTFQEYLDSGMPLRVTVEHSNQRKGNFNESTNTILIAFTSATTEKWIRKVVPHEMRHYAQILLSQSIDSASDEVFRAGLPSRSIRTPEYDQNQGTLYEDTRLYLHSLDDVEFYTNLADSIEEIKEALLAIPQEYDENTGRMDSLAREERFKEMVGAKSSPNIHRFFKYLKRNRKARGKYQKAVSEAYAALVDDVFSGGGSRFRLASENVPTNPKLWAKVQALAKGEKASITVNGKKVNGPNDGKGFTVFPSAYANGWASKVYKDLGGGWKKKASTGRHTLPPLPYAYDALEPHISEETLRFHHDKHHKAYVDGLNRAEQEIAAARRDEDFDAIPALNRVLEFNAGGDFLHTLYWTSLVPTEEYGEPSSWLVDAIEEDFGSWDAFKSQMKQSTIKVRGSGWGVLVSTPSGMRILTVMNHENGVLWNGMVLLPMDAWEHAYYLDYQNDRGAYFDAVFDNLINWNEVEGRLRQHRSIQRVARGKAKKDVGHGGLDEWFSGHGGAKGKGEDATWGDWVSISPVTKTLPSGKKVERGDIVGECGISDDPDWSEITKGGKDPLKCMPRQKAHDMPKKERAEKAQAKQRAERADSNRGKKPTRTPTFKKKEARKSYRKIPTRNLRLDPSVTRFFQRFMDVFTDYPNLWIKGGGARDALLNFYADRAGGYQRSSRPLRDIDLILIGGSWRDKWDLLERFQGAVEEEDLDNRASSMKNYIQSRDVGINEAALRPDVFVFSDKAIRDLERDTVNPSGGEVNPEWGDISPRLGLRTVLFSLREGLSVPDNPMVTEAIEAANPFNLLIHFYKAFETGVQDGFFEAVSSNENLKDLESPEEALVDLSNAVWDFSRNPKQERIYQDALSILDIDEWGLDSD